MILLDLCIKWDKKLKSVFLPEAKYSQIIYKKCLIECVSENVRWLDIGCGHHILPLWLLNEEEKLVKRSELVVGIDCDLTSLRKHATIENLVNGNLSFLPFMDKEFDLVTANMVVEHLQKPKILFQEVHRVLKYDGLFIINTPNLWGYKSIFARIIPDPFKKFFIKIFTGRRESDTFPTFYKVNTMHSIEKIARFNDFKIDSIQMLQGGPMALTLVFPIIYLIETLWNKLLLKNNFRRLRGNIIAFLRKEDSIV